MDWSEKNSCIKCDDGGNLLVCSENGCPLAVHERCLGFPAKFDDAGRFYCPYCLYRQAVAESRKAREYALARKKALLVFMDEKVIGSEKHVGGSVACEKNGHNQSKTSEANGNIATSDGGKSLSKNNGISDQSFHLDGGEKISNAEEGINDSADSKGEDPSLEILGEKGDRIEEENHVQEDEHETDAVEEEQVEEDEHETEAIEEEQIQEEEHENDVSEEEQIEEEKHETSSASTDQDPSLSGQARATRGSRRRKQVDKDSEADSPRSKRLKQHGKKKLTSSTMSPTRRSSRKSSSAVRTGKVSNENLGSPRRLRKAEAPPIKLASDISGSGKRRRLFWTEEEEEELRAGVERFAGESTNLPWKKILEQFEFDPTRTPSDLKDKWRKMSRK